MRLCLAFVVFTAALPGQTQPVAPARQASGQAVSVAAMQASVERQKTSVNAQVFGGGPADAFFSVPWTTPAEIPTPTLIPPCPALDESVVKPLVAESAKAEGVQADLVFAVIRRESAFYPCALSDKGAIGLMQLLPEVADQFHADPLDPKQNVQAGTKYLKQLLDRYKGDMRLALAAYNAGPQRVDAEKKVPDIPETTAYVDAILKDLSAKQPASK